MSGKQCKPTGEVKEKLKRDFHIMRDKFEQKNIGDYELIYPPQNEADLIQYQRILEVSKEVWES